MEALESPRVPSDPLLSSTITNRSPCSNSGSSSIQRDVFTAHLSDANFSIHIRESPHSQVTDSNVAFNQYTTLTPLQPLPPISTVTNSNRTSPPTAQNPETTCTSSALFFQQVPTNALNFNSFPYNIKYEYDLKTEPEADESQSQAQSQQSEASSSEYSSSTRIPQIGEQTYQTTHTYIPTYGTALEIRSQKQDKQICFQPSSSFNIFDAQSDLLEAVPIDNTTRVIPNFFMFLLILQDININAINRIREHNRLQLYL